jgi:hypothetical protein
VYSDTVLPAGRAGDQDHPWPPDRGEQRFLLVGLVAQRLDAESLTPGASRIRMTIFSP